jgi:hypothetical protein
LPEKLAPSQKYKGYAENPVVQALAYMVEFVQQE